MLTFAARNAPVRVAAAVFAALCIASGTVAAQEVTKAWHTQMSQGQPRAIERLVQQDIEAIFAPYVGNGPFSWEIREQTVLGSRTVYDYRIRPAPVVVSEWMHSWSEREPVATEEALRSEIVAVFATEGCPAATALAVDWDDSSGDGGGADGSNTHENGALALLFYTKSDNGQC